MNTLMLVVAIVSCALVQAQKADKDSEIIHQSQDINPDGSYQTAFETDNGIAAQEQGKLKGAGEDAGIEAQGQFTYTSPEGQKIVITYTADENGFQPNGDLPVPPPVPEAILRSLQWNAAHPEEEKEEAAGKRLG